MSIREDFDYSNYIPEDVLKEIIEAEKEITPRKPRKKKPYPSTRDLAEAIAEAIKTYVGHPNDFPSYVIEMLESKGFDTRHVTVKRIWRTYENLVRKGVIADKLGVVLR